MVFLAPSARHSWRSHASLQLGLETAGSEECRVVKVEEEGDAFAELIVGSRARGGGASVLLWSPGTQPKPAVFPSVRQRIQHPQWGRGCRSPFLPGVA